MDMDTTVTPLALTQKEIDDIKALIAAGKAPPDYFQRCADAAAINVFGVGFKLDREGHPVEQGIGSAAQPSANSVAAYEAWGRNEVGYVENLARMKKELADYQARQRSARRA